MKDKMNLVIYVNDRFEEEKALFNLETDKVLLYGDHYHDKIDERIEGYLESLKDFDIYTREVEEFHIDVGHEKYHLIDFQG